MTLFKNDVRRSFAYLFEKWGFEFADPLDNYEGMVVIAQSDKLKIRFVHDRADFSLEVSRNEESEVWIGFYTLMDRLKANGFVNSSYKYSNNIKSVSRLLEREIKAPALLLKSLDLPA